jgi:KDO2-lipid IV(A) lauroyltransferase
MGIADVRAESTGRLLRTYWMPRYWSAWCLWLWLRASALVSIDTALWVHRRIGRGLYWVARKQRRVVLRNLELCFPELSSVAVRALAKRHFEALAASFAECAIAWFAPDERLDGRFEIVGLEHLEAALERRKGVILYTGHFTTLEICGRPLKHITPQFACLFSRRSNALLEEIQRQGRMRIAHESIRSDDVRAMLRSLKRNAVVWYAPDQVYRRGQLVPFFHELAMTNVATSRLARLSGAAVIPFRYRRLDGQGRYELQFHAPLEDFPTDDAIRDTRRLVECLEEFIRACPEQYQWAHRRFRARPPELPDLYRTDPARRRPVSTASAV